MANKIKYQVDFNVKQNSLNQLKSSLQDLQKMKVSDLVKINNTDINSASSALRSVQQDAKKVESALNKAFNTKLNTLNIQTFNKELASSNLTIEKVHQSFSQVGASGQAAFNNLSAQILNTNVQLRQSSKLLDGMATSMANTIKWGITSSIFKNITGSIQSAYYYAKDLDRSLTDIRIVTGESADQMERFAQTANNAAKDLGRSTLDYTKAALSFYQQGLSDDQVQARATATLKAENITGMGSQMVDYLTSVWNGFNVQAEQAEEYVDKLAAVADTTASNMGQLATAISKVASTANAMGVDIDQLNGQVATVIATTRQAPESVGVAFKTIYARMNDIKTGADEAQISLGNYSGKMAELGFNVLDATGHLRDTGQVIEEIGSRWEGLTRQQQINLAQTMAGQRQYNNLIALFDNWDKYLQSVNTSMSAQGTLNEKNDRYLESLEAHMQTLGAEAERTYDILFDENTVKGFVDVFDSALKTFNDFISGLGGGTNAFVYFGTTIANIFNKQIAQGIQGVGTEIQRLLANINAFNTKAKVIEQVKSGLQAEYAGQGINLGNTALTQQAKAAQKTLAVQKGLTIEQQKQAVQIQKQIGLSQQKINDLEKQKNDAKQIVKSLEQQQVIQGRSIALLQQDRQNLQYSYEINQKSLTTMQGIEKSIDKINSGTLSWQQEGRITENIIQQMKNQSENLKDTWVASGGSVKDFNNHLQTINAYLIGQLDDTEKFKESWEAIKNITQQYANSQKADLEKIDLYLKNIGIDTSKLTDEEKKRLEILLQQNDALAEQGRKTINLQTLIKGISAAGMALTSIGGGISTALADGATAADKLNGTFTAINGTIGAGLSMIPGFGPALNIVWQGVSSIGKSIFQATGLWSKFEDQIKSSKERIDELKESINKIHENDKTKNAQIFNLEQVADEYQKLSKKAGEYGSNLDNLTQQEQDRYHQITNSFAEYNQAVIAGYDDQGNAIVKGQDALKDTIEVLKEAKLEADKAALGSKDKVFGGIQASHDSINKDQIKDAQKQVDEISNNLSGLDLNLEDFSTSGVNGTLVQYKNKLRDFILDTIPNEEITEEINQKFTTFEKLLDYAFQLGDQKIYDKAKSFGQELNDWVLGKTGTNVAEKEFPLASLFRTTDDMQSLKDQYLNNLAQAQKIRDDLINEAENSKYTQEDANKLIAAFQIFDNDLWIKIEENLKNTGFDSNTFNQIFIDTITSQAVNVKPEELYDILYNQALEFQETLSTYGDELSEAQKNGLKDIQEKISDNSTVDEINQVIRTSIYDNWLENPVIQEMMDDVNSRNFILELIKSVYNLDDIEVLEHYGNWVIKTLTTQMDKVMKQLPKALLSPIQGVTLDQTPLESWLRKNFQPEEVQQIIDDLIANPQTFDSLQSFQDYVNNFFENLNKEQEADKFLENVDKVITAIKKLQDGKDLSYKEKINLMTALGLDEKQVNEVDSIISALENSLDKLKDSDAPEDAVKRAEILSSIYDSYEKIDDAYQRGIISDTQASGLRQDVYNNELESLNLTEQALQEFAAANNLAFGDQQSNRKALAIYKQTQSLDFLKDSVEKASQKFKTLKEEGVDPFKDSQALGYLQQLDTLLSDLGINVDYSWIINNIDKISEALKNGTFNAETFKQQVEKTQLKEQSQNNFDKGRSRISTMRSISKNLQSGNFIEDEKELALLYEIQNENKELAELAETKSRYSQQYLDLLNKTIIAQQKLNEQNKKQAQQETKRNIANLQKRKDEIQGSLIEEDKYHQAKQFISSGAVYDIEDPKQGKIELENAQQIVRLYEEQNNERAQLITIDQKIKDEQQQLIRLGQIDLQGIKDKYHTIEQLQNALLNEDVTNQQYQIIRPQVLEEQVKALGRTQEQFEDFVDVLQQSSKDLANNTQQAEDMAITQWKMQKALDSLVDKFDKYAEAINNAKDLTQDAKLADSDYTQAISSLRTAMQGLLGVSLSNAFLSDADNLELMKEAINGNQEALISLRAAAVGDIIVNMDLNPNAMNDISSLVNDFIANTDFEDLQIGAALDDSAFINALNAMLSNSEITAAQATQILAGIGYEADVGTTSAPVTISYPQVVQKWATTYGGPDAGQYVQRSTIEMVPQTVDMGVPFIRGANYKGTKPTSNRATSHPSTSSGGSGRGSGGGKGGGSGKGTEPDTSKKDKKKSLEDDRDIYHDINIELQKINRQLDRTQKKQDRLYGKQFLDNLAKQNFFLQKQIDKLKEKGKLQQQDLKAQQEGLKTLGATFDQYGNMTNYMDLLKQKQNDYNKLIKEENNLIKAYNKSTNKDQKQAINDKISEKDKEAQNAKDIYEDLKKRIKNYDDLRKDIEDNLDQQDQKLQQEIQNKITAFRHKVKIHLELGQAQREWNDFVRNVLNHSDILKDSDFDGIFRDAQQNLSDLTTYFNVHGSIGSIEVLTKSLYDTKAIIEQIDKKGNDAIYGDTKAQAMKDLKSDLDELMKQLGDVEKLIDAIDQAYLNTIDDIAEQFDKQIEDYQYVGDLIQHDMNLLTLLYGDKNYDAMDKYYNTLQQNNEKQLDSLKQQRDFWKQRWDEAVARGETNSAKKFEENYKKILKSLNSAIEESAKLLQEKYQNSINQIFDTLDKKLTNGRGTDYLSTEWDLMNKNADEYLDTINSAFAIQSTQRKYQKALDETKSIKNQQALKKLMNQQLDILRSKEKLTEYDVERAEKMLQIEQARIALEESQSAKTSLRLKRDSQGNYSYEYAADNNAINDAEDNLAKAQNDLYNFDKDRYRSITNDMLSAWEEFKNKQLELSLKAVQGDQEAQEKLVLLREQYGQYINTKTQQNLSVRTNLTQSAFADIAAIYNNDVANYQQMADNEKQILMGQLVPIWNNGIDQMSQRIVGEGGFIPACEEAFQGVDEATRNYEAQLGQMAETAGVNLGDVKNGIDDTALSMEGLIIDNRELIDTMGQELGSIQALKAAAQQLSGAYRGVYDAAKVAVSAIHLFYQEQQKAAAQAQGYYNGGYTGIGSGSASGSSSNGSKSSNNSSSSGSGSGSGSGGSGSSGGGSGLGSSGSGNGLGSVNAAALTGTRGDYVDPYWMERKKKNYTGLSKTSRYATGGYTGDWGDNEGRLAILDKKEIVLNEDDTRNFLQSVNILRQLNSSLNNNMFNMLNGLKSNQRFNSSENTFQQNVHISATFPNVNSIREIEEAFSELVNLAAQRAMRS